MSKNASPALLPTEGTGERPALGCKGCGLHNQRCTLAQCLRSSRNIYTIVIEMCAPCGPNRHNRIPLFFRTPMPKDNITSPHCEAALCFNPPFLSIILKPMQLEVAERELWARLHRWARITMAREVAEDFPALKACRHDRRITCFLAWIWEMGEERRLPSCLALVNRHFQLYLAPADRSARLEAAFTEYQLACARYHEILPPVPDSNRYVPGFIKADPGRCAEAIVQELAPLFGKPKKLQKYRRGFTRAFGEWTLYTHARPLPRAEMVQCFSFLRRSDAPFDWSETWLTQSWSSRIDPIMMLGVSGGSFPLVGKSHELLCAQSLQAQMSLFVPSVPKLVEGLGIAD